MKIVASSLLVMAFLLAASPARAQSQTSIWVSTAYLANFDRTWSDNEALVGSGVGVAAGLDFNRRFGIEASVDFPRAHVETSDHRAVDPALGPLHTLSREEHRSPSLTVSFATHLWPAPRAQVTLLAGLTRVNHQTEGFVVSESLGAGGEVLKRNEFSRNSDYPWGGFALGATVSIRVTERLSLVPGFRMLWFPIADYGRTSIHRPSVGLRWHF